MGTSGMWGKYPMPAAPALTGGVLEEIPDPAPYALLLLGGGLAQPLYEARPRFAQARLEVILTGLADELLFAYARPEGYEVFPAGKLVHGDGRGAVVGKAG